MGGARHRDQESGGVVADAVAAFGETVGAKLGRGGAPEDQLRGPLETLLKRIAVGLGLDVVAYGEVLLKEIRARPDYAVDIGSARVGYIELKAPNRSVPGTRHWRPDKREREQWERLSALPNLVYTDGTSWGRYSFGECKNFAQLDGNLADLRGQLRVNDRAFVDLVLDFLCWKPERLTSIPELIQRVAGLCRLLRDEVVAILRGSPDHRAYEGLSLLAEDWRALLFPGLDDLGFADAYAQTIVFAMLLARLDGIVFQGTPLLEVGRQLSKKHLLIGRAFQVLLDSSAVEELRTIETLNRIIGAVDFAPKGPRPQADIYVNLYEKFLATYDPSRRKESGSYYTPERVANSMVTFVDEILRSRLGIKWGFADDNVVVVDPAMGTGTFLVEVVRRVAETIGRVQGGGARQERLRGLLSKRLVGFEIQVAPYAITELRIHQALSRFEVEVPGLESRFLTDALENPSAQQGRMGGAATWPLERSRQEANRFKRDVPVMVVIGNPPHVENTKGLAPWIEQPRRPGTGSIRTRPSLDEFRVPGLGRYASDLHGMPWLFWRWAIWKAFEAHHGHEQGVVAFIVPASLIMGKAFRGVRAYLRNICDEGWIFDLSPEGNRSKVATRIFGSAVSRQLCIVVFSRSGPAQDAPATVRYLALHGTRDDKLARLETLSPDDLDWRTCPDGWEDPFLPSEDPEWPEYPALNEIMPWRSRGVTTGRSWVYAPDADTLKTRWRRLVTADGALRKGLLKEGRDRKITTTIGPLPGFQPAASPIAQEGGPCPDPVTVAYRPFDRQWVIPDNRLMEMPRPPLWAVRTDRQIYVSEQDSHAIETGPGLLFTALIPDLHHFNGRGGGVRPLYRDAEGTSPNIVPGLLRLLSNVVGAPITPVELLAYIAAVTAHPGYTERFRTDLRMPGVRVPITARCELWAEALDIGHQVLWLHTFGERCCDESSARPRGQLALAERFGIRNHVAIRTLPSRMEEVRYDAPSQTLYIADGAISPVTSEVWEFDVGGMRVVRHWLNYRTTARRAASSALEQIRPQRWTSAMTDEILSLIAVLTGCVALHDRQADLLSRICEQQTIRVSQLAKAGVYPVPHASIAAPTLPVSPSQVRLD